MIGARQLVKQYSGSWYGGYGMIRCPCHADRTPSCKVWDHGGQTYVHCFTGCSWRDIRSALDLGQAALAADAHEDRDQGTRIQIARAIWQKTTDAAGTAVADYLHGRGIRNIPPSIRYAELKHGPSGRVFPTMVAAVANVDGEIVGIHRTFLDGSEKADVSPNKMMLGACSGGAVHFGKAVEKVAVGEGIETALSVAQAVPDIPVWAALSTNGMKAILMPKTVREVLILADRDDAGEKAARTLSKRLIREGRQVKIARPITEDFNTDLQRHSNVCRLPIMRVA